MKKILLFCEGIDHVYLCKNLYDACTSLGYSLYVLTMDISIYLQAKQLLRCPVTLVYRRKYELEDKLYLQAKEYVEKSLEQKDVKDIYESVLYACHELSRNGNFSLIIASQGIKAGELGLKTYARQSGTPILFFELANLPEKLFVDTEGSNAKSYLYSHIQVLDQYQIPEAQWKAWREKYIQNNLQRHEVKQKVDLKKYNWKYGILSRLGFLYTGLKIRNLDFIPKLMGWINARRMQIRYDSYDITKGDYVFFPMQVASDSQLVLNSDIGLFEALQHCIEKAEKEKRTLVVKLHPAEKDIRVIQKVLQWRDRYHFKIIADNTFQVIYHAQEIVTINSTVALEAMIAGKKVKILGRSFYSMFDETRLKNYILGYLVDLDYFGKEPYSEGAVHTLLRRAKRKDQA